MRLFNKFNHWTASDAFGTLTVVIASVYVCLAIGVMVAS